MTGLRIGRFYGVPVFLPRSGPVLLGCVAAGYAVLLTRLMPGLGWPRALAAACCFAAVLAGSVLAHDLGHVAVCLALRLPVRRIVVSPLAAGSDHADPRGPADECLVAIAGPLVTLALTGSCVVGAGLTGSGSAPHAVLVLLAAVNLLVLLFHLLPGPPADAGRIVYATAWWWTGSRTTGARVAARAGRYAAGVIALCALTTLSTDNLAASATGLAVGCGVGGLLWLGSAQALAEAPTEAPVRAPVAARPPEAASHRHDGRTSGESGRGRGGRHRWAALLLLTVLLAVIAHSLVGQTFRVTSGSMRDTLRPGDRLLVDRVSYRPSEVHRGDLVVFRRPPAVDLPQRELVKRVIGLPGDRVQSRAGGIVVNGAPLAEPYLRARCPRGTGQFPPIVVPPGRLYVLGDNRCNSSDSRSFGPIDARLVEGRALLLVWPPNRAGRL